MKNLFVAALLCMTASAHAERWNASNDPANFDLVATRPVRFNFSELPLEGGLRDARLGWSETYWQANLGGVAYRWNHPDPQPFRYRLFSKKELALMSEEELSQLSPAELYDIAMGDYKYSLTKKVLKMNYPDDLWWEGICHGWALAASNYPEPDRVVITNKDGIQVPFGASDVKGLLSLHDAWNSRGLYSRVGDRCAVVGKVEGEAFPEDGIVPFPGRKAAESENCRDVNAGAFHVVISSMLGLNGQGFVADVDRFNDVWNQPVVGYKSSIIEELPVSPSEASQGVARRVRVKTDMEYGDELEFYSKKLVDEGVKGFVQKEPVTGTPYQNRGVRHYEYVLELNSRGDIVGGEWISESRPDMLWMKRPDAKFMNGKLPLEGLNRIYRPIRR